MKMQLPVILALLLPLASPAAAQSRNSADRLGTESSSRDLLPAGDRAQAVRMMRGFAQCVVRGDSGIARQLLASVSGSAEERALMLRITGSRNLCLGKGQLRMQHSLLRGALAEQLYVQSFPAPLTGEAHPDAPVKAALSTDRPYQAYAGCVVTRNAPGADAVIRAEPGSAAEKSAYGQTMPALSSCLAGGDGAKLAIDRTALRGYLAEALYLSRNSAG